MPGLQNAVAFAPGLDIRTLSPKGKVGLVIGVGSVNTGGRYEWDASATIGDVPLAEMPLWLIEIIKAGQGKRGKRSRGAEFSRVTGAPIVNGTRDDALTSAAGRLKWEGKSAEETFEQLKKVRDARVEGGAEEFSDDQVLAKVESVFAYADDDSLQAIPGAPDCYHMNSKGVWYTPPPNKKEEIPDPIWVCSPLSVTAYTRSSDSEDWGRLALVRDADGRPHEWPIPMGLLAADGKELRTRLLDLGLGISTIPAARWALLAYINRCTSVVRVRSVTAPGWHLVEYVLPDCAVGLGGAPGAERVLWQNASAVEHALNVKGTIKEWQENIGKPCAGNSRLVFGVSMAAAAPLLYLLNEESGGFNYVGDSSIGKTTAQRVAGSFCGGSDTPGGYLRSWRATSNGLEAMAQLHCDGLLVLDEMSQVEPREAGQVVYMLGNGQGKSRSNRDGSGQRIKTWRLLALSSGEITLADKIAEDYRHTRPRAGHLARMIDVPADAGQGYGVFEDLHGRADGHTLVKELGGASNKYYGTALRAFIQKLQEDREGATEEVRKHRDAWKSEHFPPGADAQVERVASRFGLVAAAGELGIRFGVLPWDKGEADKAAEKCFNSWLARRGFTGAYDIEAGIAAVRKFIELHGDSRFYPAWNPPAPDYPVSNRAGFRLTSGEETEFFVLPEVWREILCGFDLVAINKALIERGLLLADGEGHACRSQHVKGVGQKRVYHLSPKILLEGEEVCATE